jgi:hypothetical protein
MTTKSSAGVASSKGVAARRTQQRAEQAQQPQRGGEQQQRQRHSQPQAGAGQQAQEQRSYRLALCEVLLRRGSWRGSSGRRGVGTVPCQAALCSGPGGAYRG